MTRNIVLIILDTVRKDYFDKYASRLQRLSDFEHERMYAASSWSAPSHASMFTGQLPHQHGIHTFSRHFDISRTKTFLSKIPHYSFGLSSNAYASHSFGFDNWFDEFVDLSPQRRFPEGLDVQKHIKQRESESLMRYIRFLQKVYKHDKKTKSILNGLFLKIDDHLRSNPLIEKPIDDGSKPILNSASKKVPAPYFQFMNLMEAHGPVQPIKGYNSDLYEAKRGWTSQDHNIHQLMRTEDLSEEDIQTIENYRNLYAAAIDYLDRHVSQWIQNQSKETTIIITSDHGENLLHKQDCGLWGHPSSTTESIINVPFLVINSPEKTKIDKGIATHLDLPKTIQKIAKKEILEIPSRDVIPVEVIGSGLKLNADTVSQEEWDATKRAVVNNHTKITWDTLGNIYRTDLDDNSTCDPISKIPTWASDVFDNEISDIRKEAKKEQNNVSVSEGTQNRLEELGYL